MIIIVIYILMEGAKKLNDSNQISTDVLKDLYKDVTEWIKFAEAKNAALLTFNGVLLFGILKLIESTNILIKPFSTVLYISSALLVINIVYILFSFLPLLNQSKKIGSVQANRSITNENLLFYGNLHKLTPDVFLDRISSKYGLTNIKEQPYFKDLSIQIITLSFLAVRKYNIFRNAVYITMGALILIVLKSIFYFI